VAVHDWAHGQQSIDDAAGKSCTDVSSGGGSQRIAPSPLLKIAGRVFPCQFTQAMDRRLEIGAMHPFVCLIAIVVRRGVRSLCFVRE